MGKGRRKTKGEEGGKITGQLLRLTLKFTRGVSVAAWLLAASAGVGGVGCVGGGHGVCLAPFGASHTSLEFTCSLIAPLPPPQRGRGPSRERFGRVKMSIRSEAVGSSFSQPSRVRTEKSALS